MPSSSPNGAIHINEIQTAALTAMAAELAGLRQALLKAEPAPVEASVAQLERAAGALRDAFREPSLFQNPPQSASPQLRQRDFRRQLEAFRRELAAVAVLARSGAAVYQGMLRLLGVAGGGYTFRGDGAPLQPAVRLLVRG